MTSGRDHGTQCDCTLLAAAVGMPPRALSFEYCRRILQKRWHLTCRHGCADTEPAPAPLAQHWERAGRIDAIQAILVSNDQRTHGT